MNYISMDRYNEMKERAERAEAEREMWRKESMNMTDLANKHGEERDALRTELRNIAKADPREWGELADQFQQWAQNRARLALDAALNAGKGEG